MRVYAQQPTSQPTPVSADANDDNLLFPIRSSGRWGYMDQRGHVRIRPQYDLVSEFKSDGFAVAIGRLDPVTKRTDDRAVVLNRRGAVCLEGDRILPLARGRFAVSEGDIIRFVGLIEPFSSTVRCQAVLGDFQEGLAPIRLGDKVGFMDETGSLAIPFILADNGTEGFMEGLAQGLTSEGWGFIDHAGQWRIRPQFDSAVGFREGLAVVGKGDVEWFIDGNGNRAIQRTFSTAYAFFAGLAAVREVGSTAYGYIDKAGHPQIPAQFSLAGGFSEGLAYVVAPREAGFIDHSGRFRIRLPSQSSGAPIFRNGLAYVTLDDKEGYIDCNGSWLWSTARVP